ncbi:hypothetical protein [Desulfosporosinus meridiei]|uniref:Uncharacterized protein n=1 Tax=Desulfosporosinus meridiei (strain ATCC BAA-275 / DSM 13257 / KCTC 12902 / NCIMB 13706 / S10) TaxID=768704 RepID=J7IVV5_DESMD|nr:hypothetical protein [Desulfosporosinus meridiei]AFQ45967.1 hypothetical protein Desmer_4138 [Desulfosporosinus meridiei DSM 13257]
MKEYIKPTTNYVELRVEESLASMASNSVLWERGSLSEPLNNENSVLFWMKVFRK